MISGDIYFLLKGATKPIQLKVKITCLGRIKLTWKKNDTTFGKKYSLCSFTKGFLNFLLLDVKVIS